MTGPAPDDAPPCDACGKPTAGRRAGALYGYRRVGPATRVKIGWYGRECFRKVCAELWKGREYSVLVHANGRRVRRW